MEIDKNASTVLFDGSCPLCTLEINQYKAITPIGQINWVDVSSPEFIPPMGQSKEILMQRFHVIQPNGEMVSGAAAFVSVWEKLPKFRYLAALSKLPGMLSAMEFGYVGFLKIRPQLQAFFAKK